MVTKQRVSIAIAMIVMLAVPRFAEGEPKTAKQAFAEASRLFKRKDYVGAIAAFEQAYRLKPHYIVQCNIARSYERLANVVQAAHHYERCLAEGGNRSKRAAAIRSLHRAAKRRIAYALVRSPGRGGTIFVDGKEVGRTPARVPLNAGRRLLEVRREGARAAQTAITIRAGESRTVDLIPVDLTPTPKPPPRIVIRERDTAPSGEGISQGWFWAGTVMTVGLTAAAVVLGIQALNYKSDFEQKPTRDGYNKAKNRRLLTNIFGGDCSN